MNRRDALKSLIAVPLVAKAAQAPKPFDSEAYFASLREYPADDLPVVDEIPWQDGRSMERAASQPESLWVKGIPMVDQPSGQPITVDMAIEAPYTGAKQVWIPQLGGGMLVLHDTGERDASGRRIFA